MAYCLPAGSEGWIQAEIDGVKTFHRVGIGADMVVYGTSEVLPIRGEPDENSPVLEVLMSGTRLSLIGSMSTEAGEVWWQVQSPAGTTGWVVDTIDGAKTLIPASQVPPATATPAVTILFQTQLTVPSGVSRYDTGLTLLPQQAVLVEYTDGSWRVGSPGTWPLVGPEGDPQVPQKGTFPVPSAAIMSLIGGIGNAGPQYIGERATLESAHGGEL